MMRNCSTNLTTALRVLTMMLKKTKQLYLYDYVYSQSLHPNLKASDSTRGVSVWMYVWRFGSAGFLLKARESRFV